MNPPLEDSVAILKRIAPYYENYHVTISPEMCRLAVAMSSGTSRTASLPDKAIDLIDEASSDVNLPPRPSPGSCRSTRSLPTSPRAGGHAGGRHDKSGGL